MQIERLKYEPISIDPFHTFFFWKQTASLPFDRLKNKKKRLQQRQERKNNRNLREVNEA